MLKKKLPVGIDNFEKLRKEDFYYVDKTGLIVDLLNSWGEVNLFTRPRRFGKTLNMSMFKSFFEIGGDKSVFDGLAVAQDKALCDRYMGKYPVVFISLKGVDGTNFEEAYERLRNVIFDECSRLKFLPDSNAIAEVDKYLIKRVLAREDSPSEIAASLKMLCGLLEKHYGQKAILLIDEYDVPLDKAFHHGYYAQMIDIIRAMFGAALKTNDSLFMAVLTGCLRVSKESIFTGLNNLKALSILDARFCEYFGFTDGEVRRMLADYGLSSHYEETKDWYDGYRFGNAEMYCPWDVINHVDRLRTEPNAHPQDYWINTSGNDMVRRFVDKADKSTQKEIERLIAGEAIEKRLRLELTYGELEESIENLWSVLFTTGYLTQAGEVERNVYKLVIPNREVREVFVLQIQEWFKKAVVGDAKPMRALHEAFAHGDAEGVRQGLNAIMGRMISILDAKAPDAQKENFYHGLLLGLLRAEPAWSIQSNVESGEGFCDILVELDDPDAGLVIEVKYAPRLEGLEAASARALEQIKEKRYDERLRGEGREDILAYGIAFCKKRCKVACQRL